MNNQIGFVLLSGGLDSATCLAYARRRHNHLVSVSFDYGQRHLRELDAARAIAERLGSKHHIIKLGDHLLGGGLANPEMEIPDISYSAITGVSPMFVHFRNGTLISLLTSFAQAYCESPEYQAELDGLKTRGILYFGAHADDAANWAYPDCSPEFVGAMANAVYIGTYDLFRLATPFLFYTKDRIVREGDEYGVPFDLTWSCYKGREMHCGTCATCMSRKDAFMLAGIEDPTEYEVPGYGDTQ